MLKEWHKKQVEWLKNKLGIDDYTVAWIAFIKGSIMIGIKQAKIQEVEDDGLLMITQNSEGYGDIIRLASYADAIRKRTGRPITIKYVMEKPSDHIHKILEYYHFNEFEVEVCPISKYKDQYTNLLKKDIQHLVSKELGHPQLLTRNRVLTPSTQDYFAIWHPFDNLEPVPKEKMPIEKKDFLEYLNEIDYNYRIITYRDSIEKIFETIAHAQLCIGYEGLGQQIAYHYDKPLVTLSTWRQVSRNTGGPKSLILKNLNELRSFINDYVPRRDDFEII